MIFVQRVPARLPFEIAEGDSRLSLPVSQLHEYADVSSTASVTGVLEPLLGNILVDILENTASLVFEGCRSCIDKRNGNGTRLTEAASITFSDVE